MIVVWLPITWQHTMVSASDCVGLTLPGMIEEPGSFSGRISSPRPERGPEPSRRMSLAILNSERRARSARRGRRHRRRARPAPRTCCGALTNGSRVIAATFLANSAGETRMRVQPGADRGAALRQRIELLQRQPVADDAALDLRGVAGELLAERQRRGVLRMGAADLDDAARTPWLLFCSASCRCASAGSSSTRDLARPRRYAWRWESCRSTTGSC